MAPLAILQTLCAKHAVDLIPSVTAPPVAETDSRLYIK
jgi:hypothetical protein